VQLSQIQLLKRTLSTYAPPVFRLVRESRKLMHQHKNQRIQNDLLPWKAFFIQEFGLTVQNGPFSGLSLEETDPKDAYLPLLIGCYEAETHPFIEAALARGPSVIIDVGCDIGYIAVGLARRAPQSAVIAFDINPEARIKCKQLAQRNCVSGRLSVQGNCTPELLQAVCGEHPLVFSDCEGSELELLDPVAVPALIGADIIVELHDFLRIDVDITPTIVKRFSETHDIYTTGIQRRSVDSFPSVASLPERMRDAAMHEDRVPYQQWAFLKSRAR
jgi:SAM-dependent methyltransferase